MAEAILLTAGFVILWVAVDIMFDCEMKKYADED